MTLIERVLAYQDAHNRHHLDLVLGMLTDDISFETVGVWVKVGKDNIRLLEEFDAGVDGSLVFHHLATDGTLVRATATERNDWFRVAGIGDVNYASIEFAFREHQICSIRAQMAPESAQAIADVLRSVVRWAAREQPEALDKLMPQGEFAYSADSAAAWVALLRTWRDAQAPRGT